MDFEHVYIIGSQRSGTTLLRLILESHPDIFCYDELLGYNALISGEIAPTPGSTRVVFKIPRWTEQLLDADICDYGEPAAGPRFYKPGQKLIFIVRDPKATVGSMVRLAAGEKSWLETYPRSIMRARIERDARFAQKWSAGLEDACQSEHSAVAVGAIYWKYKSSSFFDYRNAGLPVALVRYESLVTNPEPVLRGLCEFIDVPWNDRLLHHERLDHREVFANGVTVGNTDPRMGIHTQSLEAWRKVITDQDAAEIERITGSLYDKFLQLFAGEGIVIYPARQFALATTESRR